MELSKLDMDVAEIAALDFIDEMIDQGGELLYEHYIESRSGPFAISSTLAVIENGLEALHFRHDTGEELEWGEDEECVPCRIDTWARSAVPSRRKIKIRPVEQPSTHQIPVENKSVRSLRSTVTGKNLRQTKAPGSTFQTIEEKGIIPTPIEVPIEEVSEEEEMLRQRKERQNKRKKDEVERMKKIKEEEDEKQKKLSKETEELKKKPFTYDSAGNILMINSLKYDKMPPTAVNANFVLPQTEEIQAKPKPKREVELANPKIRKQAPPGEQDFVKNMTAVQPPLFESIKLNPGVGLVQGNQSKFAPIQSNPGQTMTRFQYQQLAKRQETQAIPHTPIEASEQKESSLNSQESPQDSLAQSRKNLLEEIPDFEVTAGQIPESEEIKVVRQKGQQYQNRVTQYGKGTMESEDMGPVDKFNMEILRNRNWGINPPIKQAHIPDRLPKRPSEKNIRATYGDIVKKPKDKPFISSKELWEAQVGKLKRPRDRPFIERVGHKTRMPAPPFGQTMVHVEDGKLRKSASEISRPPIV